MSAIMRVERSMARMRVSEPAARVGKFGPNGTESAGASGSGSGTAPRDAAWYHAQLQSFADQCKANFARSTDNNNFFVVKTQGPGAAQDLWSDWKKATVTVVDTADVLRVNVQSQEIVPTQMEVKSTFSDLDFIKNMSAQDVSQFPSRGGNQHGQAFFLTPAQIAALITLIEGPNKSTIQVSSSNADLIRQIEADNAERKRKRNAEWPVPKKRERIARFVPPKRPAERPSFSWVITPPGTGKTIMSLLAGLYVTIKQWATCKANESEWVGQLRRTHELVPAYADLTETEGQSRTILCRVCVVAYTNDTKVQWVNTVEKNKALFESEFGLGQGNLIVSTEETRSKPGKGTNKAGANTNEIFENATGDNARPVVFLTSYAATRDDSLKKIFDKTPYFAFAAGVFDEFAQQSKGLILNKGMPLVYRTFAVSATATEALKGFSGLSSKQYMSMMFGKVEVSDYAIENVKEVLDKKFTDSLKVGGSSDYAALTQFVERFVLTDVLMAQRNTMAAAAAENMPPHVRLRNADSECKTLVARMVLYGVSESDIMSFDEACKFLEIENFVTSLAAPGQSETPKLSVVQIQDHLKSVMLSNFPALRDVVDDDQAIENFLRQNHTILFGRKTRSVRAMRKSLRLCNAAGCVSCGKDLSDGNNWLALCCTAIYCDDCKNQTPCTQCTTYVRKAKSFDFKDDSLTFDQRLDAVCASKCDTRLIAFSETVAAAVASGMKRILVFTKHIPQNETHHNKVINLVRKSLESAKQALQLTETPLNLSLMETSTTMKPKAGREEAVTQFNNLSNSAVRALVLFDGTGDFDQTTGLDLPNTDIILALGKMKNPQQAFSRGLRTSSAPRTSDLTIVWFRNGSDYNVN